MHTPHRRLLSAHAAASHRRRALRSLADVWEAPAQFIKQAISNMHSASGKLGAQLNHIPQPQIAPLLGTLHQPARCLTIPALHTNISPCASASSRPRDAAVSRLKGTYWQQHKLAQRAAEELRRSANAELASGSNAMQAAGGGNSSDSNAMQAGVGASGGASSSANPPAVGNTWNPSQPFAAPPAQSPYAVC